MSVVIGKKVVDKGKCFICGQSTEFEIAKDACLFREAVCGFCGASKRNSDVAHAIVQTFTKDTDMPLVDAIDDLKGLSICEAQATGKIFEHLSRLSEYTCFEYLDGVTPGIKNKDGIRCENLEQLTFADNSFDIFITQDVLEHVSDPHKAFLEIRRVLKPGGHHIFTVPIHEGRKTLSRSKMTLDGKGVEHIKLQVSHGDPVREGGSLVYTDFGEDIVEMLDRQGMSTQKVVFSKWYSPEEITYVGGEGTEYDSYKEALRADRLDRFFKYNSIVFISKKDEMLFTGERFVPDLEGQAAYEHLHRYAIACNYVSGKTVLDIASGEGYGSNLLAKSANTVIGVDISKEAVNHAGAKYKRRKNLEYRVGSCTEIPCDDDLFDVVVSFETIEHITEHESMLAEVKRVLKPDGILIISSPNKEVYLDENEFHLKELDYNEFDTLLKSCFKQVEMMGQVVVSASHMWFMDAKSAGFRNYTGTSEELVSRCTPPYAPMFFIAVCSDKDGVMIDVGEHSLFTDYKQSMLNHMRQLQEYVADKERQVEVLSTQVGELNRQVGELNRQVDEIHRSLSWRITAPLRAFIRLIKR